MFDQAVEYLNRKYPIVVKEAKYHLELDETYYQFCKDWYEETVIFLKMFYPEFSEQKILDSYAKVSFEHLKYQSFLIKNGYYTDLSFDAINEKVYQSKQTMYGYYLPGLRLTFAFWYNHYKVWKIFDSWVKGLKSEARLVEVGVGHGSFFAHTLKSKNVVAHGFDISEHSILWTNDYLRYRQITSGYELFNREYRGDTEEYDYAICGEVLEHIPDPESLLDELYKGLKRGGELFLTTVVNAAAVDHLYLFANVSEIHEMVQKAGFSVRDELVLPVKDMSSKELEENRIPINYASILVKS